jgi:type II secretory pathway component PulF
MEFTYKAKSIEGESATGLLAAGSALLAREELRNRGLFVFSLQPVTHAVQGTGALSRSFRARISRRDLLNLTTQFAIMTRAGIDAAAALGTLADQCCNPLLKQILQQVHSDVNAGGSLSDALQKHPETFNDMYAAMVAAGESVGRLPEILQRLGELQRTELRNRGMLRAMLAYPLVLAFVSLLVMAGMVCFVLPQFAQIFEDANVALPTLTRALLSATDAVAAYLFLWLPLVMVTGAGLVGYFRTERGRRLWHSTQLNAFLLRGVMRSLLIGRTFRLLGMMVQSGVPLLEGVRLTRRSIQNLLYRDLFQKLENDILNGRKLGPSLVEAGFVPPTAAEMVITAEKTGTMGVVTQLMGEHFEEEGQERLRELTTILEPAIIVGMGLVVGLLVIAIMMPMFDMATLSNSR